jgi:hypothetical protein
MDADEHKHLPKLVSECVNRLRVLTGNMEDSGHHNEDSVLPIDLVTGLKNNLPSLTEVLIKSEQ